MATFDVYNPSRDSLISLVQAMLGVNSGLNVNPASIVLVYGNGTDDNFEIPDEEELPPEFEFPRTTSLSFYDGSIAGVGIGAGLLLTSGNGGPPLLNTSEAYSIAFDFADDTSDPQLLAAVKAGFPAAGEIHDVTSLQFSFEVTSPVLRGVKLEVVFGSDEYPEFADSTYVDIAAVFVNGVNYALFAGQQDRPLSVIQQNLSAGGFIDNTGGQVLIEYDGFSRKLVVIAPVQQGTNVIKIAVGDTGDQYYDSGIFVSDLRAVPYFGSGIANQLDDSSDGLLDGVVHGTAFADLLLLGNAGGKGIGAEGDDTIGGGAGIDIAGYAGNRAGFQMTYAQGVRTVTDTIGSQGTDTLFDVDRLWFADRKVAVDIKLDNTLQGNNAGITAKILGAVFGAPEVGNAAYAGIGLTLLDGGMSYLNLMGLALDVRLGAGYSNAQEINLLYQNLVGFAPTQNDINMWSSTITSGQFTQASLAVMAADLFYNTDNINLAGLQLNGLDYL